MKKIQKFEDLVVSSAPMVVKFGATWCGPCKRMAPTLEKLSQEFSQIPFLEVDVDEIPELSKTYSVRSVPTLLFFKDGAVYKQVAGLSLIDPLRKILRELSDQ